MSVITAAESFENGKKFFEEQYKGNGGTLFGNEGFFANINTEDRTYTLLCYIDAASDLVYMEVYPGIHVAEAYRSQVSEYINKINAMRKCTNVRVAANGSLYVHSEQDIKNSAATYDMFLRMIKKSITLLDTFEKVLDKISSGRLLSEEESSVEKVAIKRIKEIKSMNSFECGDDEWDTDDADVDEDIDDIDEENVSEGMIDFKETIERKRREIIRKILEDGKRRIRGMDKEGTLLDLPITADESVQMNKENKEKSKDEFEIFDVIEASLKDSSENNADNQSCDKGYACKDMFMKTVINA